MFSFRESLFQSCITLLGKMKSNQHGVICWQVAKSPRYGLSGDDGYGGLSLALNLVEALLCQTPRKDIDTSSRMSSILQGCGHCPSCKNEGISAPDIHIAFQW